MTVETLELTQTHDGDGVSTAFIFDRPFADPGDLKVQIIGTDGTRRTPAYDVAAGANGATITITSEVPAIGERVVIERQTALFQSTNYSSGNFPSDAHERTADRLTMAAQERKAIEGRTLRVGPDEPELQPIDVIPPGHVVMRTEQGFGTGPNGDEVSAAQGHAQAAADSAAAAADAAGAAGVSANAAAGSADAAAGAAVTASGAATTASQRADAADVAAQSAAAAATSADEDATAATNAATAAAGSASSAEQSALAAAASVGNGAVRSILEYDVAGDGVTDDRAVIQAALEEAADDGVSLFFPDRTYAIGGSGSSFANRQYGLLLRSGMRAIGQSRAGTVFKVRDGEDIDLIGTARPGPHTGVELRNLTLDGNEGSLGADPANGFNIWAQDIDGLVLNNVKSLDPASWGVRIERCVNVEVPIIVCDHSAETNSDGIHFVDTSIVTVGSAQVTTLGDDAFIIEATHQSVRDYSIGELIVDANNQLGLDARGLLLLCDDSVADGPHVISNVNAHVVAKNCKGGAVVLRGGTYINCNIDGTSRNCGFGLQMKPGTPIHEGYALNCSFKMLINGFKTAGIRAVTDDGPINDCSIEALMSTGEAGALGAIVDGDAWTGSISLTYAVPSTTAGINWIAKNSTVGLIAKNANRNIVVDTKATYNTFYLGRIAQGGTTDLEVMTGAGGNVFVGGRIVGNVAMGAAATFLGTSGPNVPV